jgi:hypothetical protein
MIANAVIVRAQLRILRQYAAILDLSVSRMILKARPKFRRGGKLCGESWADVGDRAMWEGVSRRGLVGRKARVVGVCSKRKMNPAASSHACSKTGRRVGQETRQGVKGTRTRLGEG